MAVELTTKALWAILGLALIYLSRQLGIGQVDAPGPGLMSMLLGVLIAVVAAGGFILQLVSRARAPREPWPMSAILRVGSVVALLVLYIVLLERLGFVIVTFVLLAVLFGAFAGIRWYWSLVLAAAFSGANYALFKLLLGTQLPAGLLG